MRSRYSAYALKKYQYVINTYSTVTGNDLTIEGLSSANETTQWLGLQVLNRSQGAEHGKVEFKAYFSDQKIIYCIHEASRFVLEQGAWRYLDGNMLGKNGAIKVGRNNACICQSGKKYKHCCFNLLN